MVREDFHKSSEPRARERRQRSPSRGSAGVASCYRRVGACGLPHYGERAPSLPSLSARNVILCSEVERVSSTPVSDPRKT